MASEIVLAKKGITVQKGFVEFGLPMPAVRFAIQSDRSVPMAIRIIETLPDGVSISDIGFHEEYDLEHWRSDGGSRLAYERVIEPNDRTITVFFIRNESLELEHFTDPPVIEWVKSAADASDERTVGVPHDEKVEAIPIDEAASIPNETIEFDDLSTTDGPVDPPADVEFIDSLESTGLHDPSDQSTESTDLPFEFTPTDSDEESFEEPSPDEPIELNDPDEDVIGEIDAESEAEGAQPPSPVPEVSEIEDIVDARLSHHLSSDSGHVDTNRDEPIAGSTESIVSRLFDELRANSDQESIEELEDLFSNKPPNHLRARIERIEGEITELAAYTEALKEFIDENGSARDVLRSNDTQIATIESDLDSLRRRLDAVETNADRSAIESINRSTADNAEAIAELTSKIERLDRRNERIGHAFSSIAESLGEPRMDEDDP